jgi:hypothetical protein
MSRREAAIQRVERHWAVAAMSADERRLAAADAEQAWRRLVAGPSAGATPRLARDELVSTLAGAYERAALERVPSVVATLRAGGAGGGEAAALARAELEVAARQAFVLARVLPLPPPDHPDRDFHVLRVAAMGAVGDSSAVVDRWLDAVAPGEPLAVDSAPWDRALRSQLAGVWLDLLRGPTGARVERAFETIGALREEQAPREAAALVDLSTARAQQVRVQLFALYHLADAAAALVVHLRRGRRPDTVARIADALERARTVTVAHQAFDVALQWLTAAGALLAEGASDQIELPGVSS